MTETDRRGTIVTFYSFKGGTGRTMMLANVAWLLAANGYRVLAVDWDLEAPGMHRYFRPFLADEDLKLTDGVIDFASDYCVAATLAHSASTNYGPAQARDLESEPWFADAADLTRLAVPVQWEFGQGGTLEFVAAGRQGASYSTRVNGFSWRDFYEKFGGGLMLDRAASLMRKRFDVVLLDSRTGVSDTSGICTVQLPDTLVTCFTLNNQSVDGAAGVAASARRQNAALRVLPVPMRIDNSETDKLDARRLYAMQTFGSLVPGDSDGAREAYWADVEVLYVPYYAYEESLAAFKDRPGQAYTLLSAAERLANLIVSERPPGPVPHTPVHAVRMSESRRQEVLAIYEGKARRSATSPEVSVEGATVFVSYSRVDGRYVTPLYDRLAESLGMRRVFIDRAFVPGDDWQAAAERAIAQSAAVLVVVGPGWEESGPGDFVAREVTIALESGRRVIPVLVGGATLPAPDVLERHGLGRLASLTPAVLPDPVTQRDIDRLVAAVELASEGRPTTPAPTPYPFPSPAPSSAAPYGRSARSDDVIESVLKAERVNVRSQWIAIASVLVALVSLVSALLVLLR